MSLPTALPPSDQGYLLTVPIASSDSRESLAGRYGGEVIAWLEDKAILKLSNQAAAALSERGVSLQNTALQPNSTVSTPAISQGFNSWAGGFNSWAGGFNSWAGGWSSWASGTSTIPALPSENRFQFMLTKVPQAQALSRNFGQGIKVAVIDTGIDLNHPQFVGRLAPASEHYDYVGMDAIPQEVAGSMYGHGTGVASLILQVAPRATILPIRVLNGDGAGTVANVVSAIQLAMNMNAQIINLSLGTTTNDVALQTIINSATNQGRYIIASAGNTGDSNITFPAAWAKSGSNQKYVLSVGSVSSTLTMSLFSCSGTALEFVAPGALIAGAYPNSRYAYYTGTSFAAPQVSGALALAMSDTNPGNWSNQETFLFDTDTPIGSYGLINVVGLLQRAPDVVRRKALLVVADAANLTNDESLLRDRLVSLGYNVILQTDDTSATSNATGMNVVVISASTDDKKILNKYASVAVPVVVINRFLYDDMRMVASGAFQSAASQTQVAISASSHPLAAGYTVAVPVYSSSTSLQWGTVGSGAVNVATVVGNSSRSAIFGYDIGSSMVGMTAPARRVGFFLWTDGASRWTAAGSNLFEAAITWAVSGN